MSKRHLKKVIKKSKPIKMSANKNPFEHYHVCLLARLFDFDTFYSICPSEKVKKDFLSFEICEDCDKCPYMTLIEHGKNGIALDISSKILVGCPLNGDKENDCQDCVYGEDYHYDNGECVLRGDKNV